MEVFSKFDKDGDNIITMKELRDAISLTGLDVPVAELEELMKNWDQNGK